MLLGWRMSRLVRFAELCKHSNFFISYVIMQPHSYCKSGGTQCAAVFVCSPPR